MHRFAADFPFLEQATYLNTAAESLLPRRAHAALARYADDKARGERGRSALYAVEQDCRVRLASLLGVPPADVAFVASTARAIDAVVQALPWQPGDNLVTDDLEFPTTIFAALRLGGRGIEPRIVRGRRGVFTPEDVAVRVDSRTRLVCVSLVSFHSGLRLDLAHLADLVHARGALLLVDVAQAAGAVPVDGAAADFLVGCAFKWLLGAHGAGFLVVRSQTAGHLEPSYVGWRSVRDLFAPDRLERYQLWPDARRFEEGSPAYTALYVLADSLAFVEEVGLTEVFARIEDLAGLAAGGLRRLGINPLTPEEPGARAGIIAFETPDCARIVAELAARGVYVWGRDGRVRLSPHFYNESADVACFVSALAEFV